MMQMIRRHLFIAILAALASSSLAQVTVHSLLQETTDLTRLTRRPSPAYTMAQASSYDRKSVKPGNPDWFANDDHGQYVRSYSRYGRTEYVLADLKGPGAVMRFWSANPDGIVHFYFDGEEVPRLEAPLQWLLDGDVPPFRDPFAYAAGDGHDLYFPIPYSQSLIITVSNAKAPGDLYYHVGYRTYAPGTKVETFPRLTIKSEELDKLSAALLDPDLRPMPAGLKTISQPPTTVTKDKPLDIEMKGGGAVYELSMKVSNFGDVANARVALRNLILEGSFDGEKCIETPLGDFFGTAAGFYPYEAYPFSIEDDDTMICRFVMPYKRGASFVIKNLGDMPADVTVVAKTGPYRFDDRSYYFHAQWTAERKPTRPFRDINLLSAQGEGLWVGDSLHVFNPAKDWWGEGDEKVFVDGESFPSTIGTGSEDFYGYAWGSTKLFSRPYHAQSFAEGPGSGGNTVVHRWNVLDPIPYTKELSFNIEAWSWNEHLAPTFAHTSYWYSRPGGQALHSIATDMLAIPTMPAGS
jgi:hypothetical protein